MMLSASIASAIFIFSAVFFAMPISGTHTVIGALIGAGLVGVNSAVINWAKLGSIVASWFISPAVSILLSFMLFSFVCWTILDHKKSQNSRLITICQLCAFSFLIIAIMIINLLPEKVCEENDADCEVPSNSTVYGITLPIAYFSGLFFCRIFMVVFSRKDAKMAEKNSCCDELKEVLFFWQNKLILSNLENS
jgi:phosphate/sulfate permease